MKIAEHISKSIVGLLVVAQITLFANGQQVQFEEVLRLPLEGLYAIALSPSADQLVLERFLLPSSQGTDESVPISIAIYDVLTGKAQAVLHEGADRDVELLSRKYGLEWRGRFIGVVVEDKIMVWEAGEALTKRYELQTAFEGSTAALSINAATDRLAVANGALVGIYELGSGMLIARAVTPVDMSNVAMLVWSPDGERLALSDGFRHLLVSASASAPNRLTVGDLWQGTGRWFRAIGWLNNRTAVLVSGEGQLYFWDAQNGKREKGTNLRGLCAALSPDGKWAAVVDASFATPGEPVQGIPTPVPPENVIKLFRLPEAELVAKLPFDLSYEGGMRCVQIAFSPDGKRIAAIIDGRPRTLYVWARAE